MYRRKRVSTFSGFQGNLWIGLSTVPDHGTSSVKHPSLSKQTSSPVEWRPKQWCMNEQRNGAVGAHKYGFSGGLFSPSKIPQFTESQEQQLPFPRPWEAAVHPKERSHPIAHQWSLRRSSSAVSCAILWESYPSCCWAQGRDSWWVSPNAKPKYCR